MHDGLFYVSDNAASIVRDVRVAVVQSGQIIGTYINTMIMQFKGVIHQAIARVKGKIPENVVG